MEAPGNRFREECPACAWLEGCRKVSPGPAQEGWHCLDFVHRDRLREMLGDEHGGHE